MNLWKNVAVGLSDVIAVLVVVTLVDKHKINKQYAIPELSFTLRIPLFNYVFE